MLKFCYVSFTDWAPEFGQKEIELNLKMTAKPIEFKEGEQQYTATGVACGPASVEVKFAVVIKKFRFNSSLPLQLLFIFMLLKS